MGRCDGPAVLLLESVPWIGRAWQHAVYLSALGCERSCNTHCGGKPCALPCLWNERGQRECEHAARGQPEPSDHGSWQTLPGHAPPLRKFFHSRSSTSVAPKTQSLGALEEVCHQGECTRTTSLGGDHRPRQGERRDRVQLHFNGRTISRVLTERHPLRIYYLCNCLHSPITSGNQRPDNTVIDLFLVQ